MCSHLQNGHHIREKCPCCGESFESGGKSYGSDELYKHLTSPSSKCHLILVQEGKGAVVDASKIQTEGISPQGTSASSTS
jgi:hypothetical protein